MAESTIPLYYGKRFDGVAYLVVVSGPGIGKHYKLRSHAVLIGRAEECDVVLEAPGVSRRHCELRWTADDGWTVHDQGSTNGTFVDGSPVGRGKPLPIHGTVTLGESVLTLTAADPADADSSPQAHDVAPRSEWSDAWATLSSRERSEGV